MSLRRIKFAHGHLRDAVVMRGKMCSAEAEHAFLLVPLEQNDIERRDCIRRPFAVLTARLEDAAARAAQGQGWKPLSNARTIFSRFVSTLSTPHGVRHFHPSL
ncbi:MAG: hypothetical protein H2052_08400 [Sphingosinicella sp.]|nr:hypothetical protein [Sphingosinicella sp.]